MPAAGRQKITRHLGRGDPRVFQPQSRSTFELAATVDPEFSSILLADQSWRQYVSLVVIAGVLIDILLGSPLANSLLKPMKGDQATEDAEVEKKAQSPRDKSRERIDSEAVAQAAIARAEGALELRKFLDERKTDWDKFEEMKRKLDSDMESLDSDLERRQAELAKKRTDS